MIALKFWNARPRMLGSLGKVRDTEGLMKRDKCSRGTRADDGGCSCKLMSWWGA